MVDNTWIFDAFCWAFILLIVWAAICQLKEHNQRISMINRMIDDYDVANLLRLFDKVSRQQHLWALFTFRDPMKLYDERLRKT